MPYQYRTLYGIEYGQYFVTFLPYQCQELCRTWPLLGGKLPSLQQDETSRPKYNKGRAPYKYNGADEYPPKGNMKAPVGA